MRQGRSSPPHHANLPAAAVSPDPELYAGPVGPKQPGDDQHAHHLRRPPYTESPAGSDGERTRLSLAVENDSEVGGRRQLSHCMESSSRTTSVRRLRFQAEREAPGRIAASPW